MLAIKTFAVKVALWFMLGAIGTGIVGIIAGLWWLDHVRFVY